MLSSVTEVMMVLFCRVGAVGALKRLGGGQGPGSNCIVHGKPGKYFLRMKFLPLKIVFSPEVFAFCALAISFLSLFEFFALRISFVDLFIFCALSIPLLVIFNFCAVSIPFLPLFAFFGLAIPFLSLFSGLFAFFRLEIEPLVEHTTVFALICMTVLFLSIFVEFGKRFDFFALRTSFGYDRFKHDLCSLKVRRLCLEPVARYAYHWLALFSHMNVKYQ